MVGKSLPKDIVACNQLCTLPVPPLVPLSNKRLSVCNQSPLGTVSGAPTSSVLNKSPNKREHNPTHVPRDGLLNLSKHELSAAETSLLKKGLSFVPTPQKIAQSNYENALTKLCQNYKNRFSLPKRSKRLIDCSFEAIKYDLSNVEVMSPDLILLKRKD